MKGKIMSKVENKEINMNSHCKALDDYFLGECKEKQSCLRHQLYIAYPQEWASHRQCRTHEYRFFIPITENEQDEINSSLLSISLIKESKGE